MKKMYKKPSTETMSYVGNHALCASGEVVNNNALPGGNGGETLDPIAD